jgi:RNA polymerase sigma-70 factor (ECF subfamily)
MGDGHEEIVACIPRLRRYARALLGNRADADDLVQDTIERGLARIKTCRPGSDMRAWLFGIMHNLHVDHVRKPALPTAPLEDDLPLPDGDDDPCHALQMKDLNIALYRLTPEQREVLLLVTVEEMTYEEVASALHIPPGTVMSRLARARERMRVAVAGNPAASRLKVVK